MRMPVQFVEKDFWVTELLRAVVSEAADAGAIAVFKGGTSLSKAYRLVEDIEQDVAGGDVERVVADHRSRARPGNGCGSGPSAAGRLPYQRVAILADGRTALALVRAAALRAGETALVESVVWPTGASAPGAGPSI